MASQEPLSPEAVELLEAWPFFDNAVVRHGFATYMRDYEVHVIAGAAAPDGTRSYQEGRYRFVFTHCVVARAESALSDDTWRGSWGDVFCDYAAWEQAGCPVGYVFGVNAMEAYPGAKFCADSPLAAGWTRRLGRPMHEVTIETNGHRLQLVFHSLRIHKVAQGDPATNSLSPIEPIDLLAPPS
ncbi:MAG TPA: hypothetical protein VND64_13460 [Pirellulales bacterium]|nr:hypothetical protein [Pirellulales bacterium]